jgi:hypothetical protein
MLSSEWRKSTFSNGQASCVEVRASAADTVAVRDTKDRNGPELAFISDEWAAFVQGVKRGEFDLT